MKSLWRNRGYRHAATHNAARYVAAALLAAAFLVSAGCAVQPWVKPYERDHLADPIMSFNRNPVSSQYTDHVREVREGARGATVSAGGGCGCN